uniref:Uncharacterized protein n=1 Tax=Quercus lobata TaxID=97700 RepID=A0A7N2N363_QUELO
MTIAGRFEVRAILVLGLAFSCCVAESTLRRGLVGAAGPTDFNVNSYGAKADGKTDNVEEYYGGHNSDDSRNFF